MLRVLGIDIGIWTFSFCVCVGNQIVRWQVVSLPEEAGFIHARRLVSFFDMPASLLIQIVHDSLSKIFPAKSVCHDYDFIAIESQPRKRGKASRIVEVGMAVYRYFHEIATADTHGCGCWRAPTVKMIGAASKFYPDKFFGFKADGYVPAPGISAKAQYLRRKQYAVDLVNILLNDSQVECPLELREMFLGMKVQHDPADAFLIMAIQQRRLSESCLSN